MQSFKVGKNEANQRLDKLLMKKMNKAPKSFIYKMLRKKNITLNSSKAKGSEILNQNDEIKMFLSDQTIEKFTERADIRSVQKSFDVIYEDEYILVVNKPLGLLSQKAKATDVSLNEEILSYLLKSDFIDDEELQTFKPSICNRLDRNTSGLIIAGKTLISLQTMAELFRKKDVDRYYLTIVCGHIKDKNKLSAYLSKDKNNNTVTITPNKTNDSSKVAIEYEPISYNNDFTLLKVKLLTGKTHQIRALLSYINHPILGDYKYGKRTINDNFKNKYKLKHQLLHSYKLSLPIIKGELANLSKKTFKAETPEVFTSIRDDIFI